MKICLKFAFSQVYVCFWGEVCVSIYIKGYQRCGVYTLAI